ncbi:sphingosine kinase 1-like [Cucurbita maxima]|uniref:Sphingosine kinase 1-like n=1 Tax=Cucurbita maxima TaxID=3661 RepID=A0A6J1KMJ8_CUCMA|nr:sphingosine kinase 1-like [Cucurbita maxima]
MDQSGVPEPVLNHRLLLDDGIVTPMILTADGWLRWSEKGQQSLAIGKEVIGLSMDGPKIRIKALVEDRGGLWCFGSSGALVRKESVFQPRECSDLLGAFIFLFPLFPRSYKHHIV